MIRNVIVKEVAQYLPSKKVDNEYYAKYFEELNIKSKGLHEAVGRDTRYIIEDQQKENTYTMGLAAAKMVLEKSNVNPLEFDVLVFVSDMPEHLAPTSAVVIREEIGAYNAHMVFDFNLNCAGTVGALDTVSSILKTHKLYKKALIVSGFHGSMMARPDCPVSTGCLNDGGSALILEVVEEEKERGVIGANYLAETTHWKLMSFPECGVSNIHNGTADLDPNTKKMYYAHTHDTVDLSRSTIDAVSQLLEENQLKPEDIQHYMLSQFDLDISQDTAKAFNLPIERFTNTMPDYGYVGNASPLYSLKNVIETKQPKEGELGILSSVAAGTIVASVLYKF